MNKSKWLVLTLVFLVMLAPVSAVFADAVYTVQPGDTLSKIAREFNTSVEAIVAANEIGDPDLIFVGMMLTIPESDQPADAADVADSQPPANISEYVVQLGDSLSKIAAQYGLEYGILAWVNAIEAPYILQVGQIVSVPDPLSAFSLEGYVPPQSQPQTAPVAQAEESPPAAPPAQVSPQTVQPVEVQVYETTVTIPTYDYEQAFVPTEEDDDVYPYPRMDHDLWNETASQTYTAVVLENGYVAVTILPELGGRVYGWEDKSTGRQLLYQNPVVKPTNWGYRGWWLGAGGIEWAFPVEEHGLNEWRPWSYTVGADSVTVSNIEDRTGMEVGATISLSAEDAVMTLEPWARNETDSAQPYQLWLNGMLALDDNQVSEETQFILPVDEVMVHSTGDEGLPGEGEMMEWPDYDGRDISTYGTWEGWLGFFAPTGDGFSGLYDHCSGQGMVRAFSPDGPEGTKFFGPGTLPPWLWTDDDSNYVELWSGATPTFWDYADLPPGETVTWTEYWYPVHDMGGYDYANRQAALRLSESEEGADVGLALSEPVNGKLILFAGDQAVAEWPVDMGPGQVLQASWLRSDGQEGPLGLQLENSDGAVVAQMGQVP